MAGRLVEQTTAGSGGGFNGINRSSIASQRLARCPCLRTALPSAVGRVSLLLGEVPGRGMASILGLDRSARLAPRQGVSGEVRRSPNARDPRERPGNGGVLLSESVTPMGRGESPDGARMDTRPPAPSMCPFYSAALDSLQRACSPFARSCRRPDCLLKWPLPPLLRLRVSRAGEPGVQGRRCRSRALCSRGGPARLLPVAAVGSRKPWNWAWRGRLSMA